MYEILTSLKHRRDWNGNVMSDDMPKPKRKKRNWVMAVVGGFCLMTIMLGASFGRSASLSGQLGDMTELYKMERDAIYYQMEEQY